MLLCIRIIQIDLCIRQRPLRVKNHAKNRELISVQCDELSRQYQQVVERSDVTLFLNQ